MQYTKPLARLIEHFQKLPSIGPKSAQRMAFQILKMSNVNSKKTIKNNFKIYIYETKSLDYKLIRVKK